MRRFKKIMVVYNRKIGDDAGLERAINLARANNAHLTVAETVGDGEFVDTRIVDERSAHLNRFAAGLCHEGVSACAQVLHGNAAVEIMRHILEENIDLLLVSEDRSRGWQYLTQGGTVRSLIRKCPCPVWVIQPDSGPRFGRVLAAVELDDNQEARALDLKVLELASSLARGEGCRLDTLHAWDFTGLERDTSRSEITPEIMNSLVDLNIRRRKALMKKLLGSVDLEGVGVSSHFPRGETEEEIQNFVPQNKIDLVVMGSRPPSGFLGLWAGGAAEGVIAATNCAILVIKPDGYISPIEQALVGNYPDRRPTNAA
ncbi:MAG: universal stress protein E [Alphaproteobacteria bacterium]|jgi:universal stress protein E